MYKLRAGDVGIIGTSIQVMIVEKETSDRAIRIDSEAYLVASKKFGTNFDYIIKKKNEKIELFEGMIIEIENGLFVKTIKRAKDVIIHCRKNCGLINRCKDELIETKGGACGAYLREIINVEWIGGSL